MDEDLHEEFLDAVMDTVAKRDAQKIRTRWGGTDEEIRVLSLMAARLKTELEETVRETYDKAGLPNPMKNLQIVLYPRAPKPQETVVSFMLGERVCRIAAVMDGQNRPVFRGITPDAAALLSRAKPTGGVKNVEKAIFSNLITMLSDESLSRMRIALAPRP
jgi:hypothetical protein